jgi:hypothetical protein
MFMNRKTICITVILLVMCSSIGQFASAQSTTVGVSVGNSYKYRFGSFYYSDSMDSGIPAHLVEDNKTEWVQYTVTGISNTTVSYFALQHFENGSENSAQNQADIATGEGAFPIIRANVGLNERVYPSLNASPVATELLNRTYQYIQRTVVHVSWNETGETQYNVDAYFDQQTGMLVEMLVAFPQILGVGEYVWTLIESSVWTVPEFPSIIVLPLVAALTLLAVAVYKTSLKGRVTARQVV